MYFKTHMYQGQNLFYQPSQYCDFKHLVDHYRLTCGNLN